ncbi:uncharacterized protein LOC110463026 isoform X1 [Mizuhopecten yessoensis]|uniref:uncharacterized protein LOC110463026 isoform X1 n=1 Tax=Mizuhopecten yessoensis TaxID=6573 RepID=UPI000B45E7B3|nr:uncharacterized protein LOC110463026 isoform X1 [Mizuhopecten yessoensis]
MHRGSCKPVPEPEAEAEVQEEDDTDVNVHVDTGVQCDEDPLLLESRRLQEEVRLLKEEVRQLKWGVGKIKDNDTRTRFYTGLPTFAVFLWLYKFHDPCAGCFPVIPDP